MRLRAWQIGGALVDLHQDGAKRALMKAEAIFEVETGLGLSAYDITADSIVRSEWSQAVRQFFERYDYLVMPTAQVFPFDAAQTWPREVAGRRMRTYHEWMQAVSLVTMSGCPALAVPAGFSAQSLPMGLQIIAPAHQELACLKLGLAYETATRWTTKRPPPMLVEA
jgi:amidase